MIRKKKLYARPKRLYEKVRILEENKLMANYALKNKKEIWKADAKINYYRSRAKELAKKSLEEQKVLFDRLTALGIKVNSIADILALKIENLLERRLPTIIVKKGIAKTAKQARQMVSHKNILINGNVVNTPGYIVPVSEENLITLRKFNKKPKEQPSEKKEEKPVENK
ncbi:MAG: 30S ribosomal protein S4 [Nanoarchaeota archaeon]